MIQIILALCFGLLVEAFFQLIKYKDAANTDSPRVVAEYFNPTHYMSVTQFAASGSRKWAKYFTFRFVPPLIIFTLLVAVLQKHFDTSNATPLILLACVVSLVTRDIARLFSRKAMTSEKIIHTVNITALVALAASVGASANYVDVSFLAPSLEGIVDNLWAALFTAMLVVVYIRTTTISEQGNDSTRKVELANMTLRSYAKIRELYYHAVTDMCNENETSVPLFYAILIYEDINRPEWLRKIENMIVRITKKELTVGIAQVKSDKPLSDIESMNKAASILKNTQALDQEFEQGIYSSDQLHAVIGLYNNGLDYQDAVVAILKNLRLYAGELFSEVEDILEYNTVEDKK